MPSPLLVSEEDPVELDGSIDGTGQLQLLHDSDSLADYDQTLHAEHSDLNESTGFVRVKLLDFSSGGTTWECSATHVEGTTTVGWSRGSGHASYDFGPMTSELDVTVTATSTSGTKQRVFKLKTKPTDAQPDRPPS